MKLLIKFGFALLLVATAVTASAQTDPDGVLSLGKVNPYAIEVTFEKTTHIIFPSGIRYVDLGSDYIIAGKAADADNVLRVKAAVAGFEKETNFSVITEDGNFYSFSVCYSDSPEVVSYNLVKGMAQQERLKTADVKFEGLGQTPASLTGLLMEALYEKNRKAIKNIRSASYGITFSLIGIYVHEGKYYFHTKIENETLVPFSIDFIKFRIVDRKVAKRTVMQERELDPLRMYKPLLSVAGSNLQRNVFLLDVFTLTKGQVLYIEIVEKNGGRGQVVKVKNSDLIDALPLEKLRLKI